jgi:hypothetical protein
METLCILLPTLHTYNLSKSFSGELFGSKHAEEVTDLFDQNWTETDYFVAGF